MKVVFCSNYLNHHQLPFCKQMLRLTDNNFYFVSQKAVNEKRLSLGYKNIANDYAFNIRSYENQEEFHRAFKEVSDADYVLWASSKNEYLYDRLKNNKITFKSSERLFKQKFKYFNYLRSYRRVYLNHKKFDKYPLYALCCGGYAANDFNAYGAYINKTYKWGYFPETHEYNIEQLINSKKDNKIHILWVGRLISWKHPEKVIELANSLRKENYDFEVSIIGSGELENDLKKQINDNKLNDYVKLLGSMSPEEVRKYMEKANIFVFTSDYNEGWGAVLNEAMNSGCASVVSHAIGSASFLIKNNENGLIYKNEDTLDLIEKVKYLINNEDKRVELGTSAYKTISELWNAKVAAERFLVLAKCLEEGKDTPFVEGPCSKAYPIKDKEMYNYLVNENSRN